MRTYIVAERRQLAPQGGIVVVNQLSADQDKNLGAGGVARIVSDEGGFERPFTEV